MSCETIDELLAAFALDALDADEAERARAHLTDCRRHDGALAGLGQVTTRLALAAEPREPPADLRGRLLASFDGAVAGERKGRPAAPWGLPSPAYLAAAAVLALAVIGLGVWNAVLQLDDGGGRVAAELVSDAGGGRVIYLTDDRLAVIDLDLPDLAPERTYQAWGIYQEGPVSLGLVPSRGVVALSADLSEASAVAISEEPAGGSPQPTSDPLAVAKLG